jgi:hypothetical protein
LEDSEMKHLLPILAISMLATALLAEDALKIPEGIRYKEAPTKVNEEAKKLLLSKFSAKAKDAGLSQVLCGAGGGGEELCEGSGNSA